jgi:uncharacterized protein (TIGR02265 family)
MSRVFHDVMELQTQHAWNTPPTRTTSVPHRTLRREPVVFGHALETLLAGAGTLGPQALEALAGLGLSPREPLRAAYPGVVWTGAIHVLSSVLYPHLSASKAEFALGRRFTEQSLVTRMGAAMHAHARAVGPERTLLRLSHNLRTSNNFIGAAARELPGQRGWELVMRPLPEFLLMAETHGEPPHFTRGVLTTTFHAAGVSSFRMEVVRHDEQLGASTFHITF